MKKFLRPLMVFIMLFAMIGCGTIESNNVGVRTSWDKKINPQEEGDGFYTALFSSVEEFSGKEITIDMKNMRPQAGDNLNLQDLDLEVYYSVDKGKIADLNLKYANRNAFDNGKDVWLPAYDLVKSIARNSTYSQIGQTDSLDINKSRDAIAMAILNEAQSKLDASDPGVFTITKVIIRNVQVDPSIQDSIKINVAKDKELEAAKKQESIATAIARANAALDKSLTPAILEARRLDVMELAVKEGKNLLVTIGGGSGGVTPLMNVTPKS